MTDETEHDRDRPEEPVLHASQLANDLTYTGERDPITGETLRPQGPRELTPEEAGLLAEYVNHLEYLNGALEVCRLCAVTMLANKHGPELNREAGFTHKLFGNVFDKLTEQQRAFVESLFVVDQIVEDEAKTDFEKQRLQNQLNVEAAAVGQAIAEDAGVEGREGKD